MIRGKVVRAAGLGRSEWWFLARAYLWLAAARGLLACAGFMRARRMMLPPVHRAPSLAPKPSSPGPAATPSVPAAADPSIPARHARSVAAAARIQPGEASCLARSMTLCRLLRADGLDGRLRIGVRRQEGSGLEAHAWAELKGVPIGESSATIEAYTVLKTPEAIPSRLIQ